MLCVCVHAFLLRFTLCVVYLLIFDLGGRSVVDCVLVCAHAHRFIPEHVRLVCIPVILVLVIFKLYATFSCSVLPLIF